MTVKTSVVYDFSFSETPEQIKRSNDFEHIMEETHLQITDIERKTGKTLNELMIEMMKKMRRKT